MENKHFSLETRDNSRLTRVFQIIFGVLCVAVAVYWLIHNISLATSDKTVWITIVFLTCFGAYLVLTGAGYGSKYIDFSDGGIIIKKDQFLPAVSLKKESISKIDVYPLKVVITPAGRRPMLIRFGISDVERVESIKDEFISYATENGIAFEILNES